MPVQRRLTSFGKEMRAVPTRPEAVLWGQLRRRQLLGLRFRRQQPVGPYIVGFYCAEIKLIIELDGAGHDERKAYDEKRNAWLEQEGCKVLRIGSQHRIRTRFCLSSREYARS